MKTVIQLTTQVNESPRVEQVRGLFDLPSEETSSFELQADLPLDEKDWHVGLIVGPSGSGKTSLANALKQEIHALSLDDLDSWPEGHAVIDGFPNDTPIKEVTNLLCAVGFSSPPAWLRPYNVLSTGQKFRCDLARLLASAAKGQPVLFDEYTSVVDRTVAQIGSAAVSKAVRSRKARFVAVTCHEDVEEWLQPDWTYRPAESLFTWRLLRQRPKIQLEVSRTKASAWKLFAPHHYLSADIVKGAWCFLATWKRQAVAFSAWLPFVGSGPPSRREHRTVVLPDFQGVGIGMALSNLIASMWRGIGIMPRSTTTHPGFVAARNKSPHWRVLRSHSLAKGRERGKFRAYQHADRRWTTGWEYVGPAMPRHEAERLLDG